MSARSLFQERLTDLAGSVVAHDRPLTFVLGAGASLSSGAPATSAVQSRLSEKTQGRFGGSVREYIHELRRREVRDHLVPLFADVVPDVGYRLLAAMGRDRRINVITLNWDSALEGACDELGVAYETFDPSRDPQGALPGFADHASVATDPGLHIVHVHGRLGDDLRYGFLDTAPSRPELLAAIEGLLRHDTIIVGASLSGDADVAEVLSRANRNDRDDAAVWYFARPDSPKPYVAIPSHWHQTLDHAVDFDDLMIELAEQLAAKRGTIEARWADLLVTHPTLGLPSSGSLVDLIPAVRRRALSSRVAGFVSPPYSGKTVAAVRVAHLWRLVHGLADPIRVVPNASDAPAALALANELGGQVTILDDPFGQHDGAVLANSRVPELALEQLGRNDGFVVIASPIAPWDDQAQALVRHQADLYVPSRNPAHWYASGTLERAAQGTVHEQAARRAIAAGTAATPPEVADVGRSGTAQDPHRRVNDKYDALARNPDLARFACLVRLQEVRSSNVPLDELTAVLGKDPRAIAGADALLIEHQLDEHAFWVFEHHTSRQATERYLKENFASVTKELRAGVFPAWVARALASWATVHAVPSDFSGLLESEFAPEIADIFAARIGKEPTEEEIAALARTPIDGWATLEYAYEIVRIWESIEHLAAGQKLLTDLLETTMGTYATLEGCLYQGLGVDDQLWARVIARLWQMSARARHDTDPELRLELLLAIDAVMWRVPKQTMLSAWATKTLSQFEPDEPAFALVLFAAAYHPDGYANLVEGSGVDVEDDVAWTYEQASVAAALIAWHYAHQCRSRVLVQSRPSIDKDYLCQSLGDAAPGNPSTTRAQLRLMRALARFPETAGWGFHVACNLASLSAIELSDGRVRRAAEACLTAAPPGDPGVLTAVLAYRSAERLAPAVNAHFSRESERVALLDAMSYGFELPGDVEVKSPRFRYIHDPARVSVLAGLTWTGLRLAGLTSPPEIAARIWAAASKLPDDERSIIDPKLAQNISRIERGDLRPAQVAARGISPSEDPFENVLRAWIADTDRLL